MSVHWSNRIETPNYKVGKHDGGNGANGQHNPSFSTIPQSDQGHRAQPKEQPNPEAYPPITPSSDLNRELAEFEYRKRQLWHLRWQAAGVAVAAMTGVMVMTTALYVAVLTTYTTFKPQFLVALRDWLDAEKVTPAPVSPPAMPSPAKAEQLQPKPGRNNSQSARPVGGVQESATHTQPHSLKANPVFTQHYASTPSNADLSLLVSNRFTAWLQDEVPYIISDDEREEFQALRSDDQKAAFIEDFWIRRDPTPATPVNEVKEEHYRRLTYANKTFGYANTVGSKTDRGRLYIVLGPPTRREPHPNGLWAAPPAPDGHGSISVPFSAPFEVWSYRHVNRPNSDLTFEFVDGANDGGYQLVSTSLETVHASLTGDWVLPDTGH